MWKASLSSLNIRGNHRPPPLNHQIHPQHMTKSTFPLRSQQYTAWLDSASVVFHYNWAPHQGGWNLHSKEDLNSSDIISTCHKQPWFINSMVPPKCLFLTITLNVFILNMFLIPGSIWLLIKDSWKESREVQGTNLQTVSLRVVTLPVIVAAVLKINEHQLLFVRTLATLEK